MQRQLCICSIKSLENNKKKAPELAELRFSAAKQSLQKNKLAKSGWAGIRWDLLWKRTLPLRVGAEKKRNRKPAETANYTRFFLALFSHPACLGGFFARGPLIVTVGPGEHCTGPGLFWPGTSSHFAYTVDSATQRKSVRGRQTVITNAQSGKRFSGRA